MARQLFSNNAVSLLALPMSASDTTLTVMAGHGSLFPQPSAPDEFFLITLENQSATIREIIRVGGRVGDTFTNITRAQEGTSALSWGASVGNDTLVDHRITAQTMYWAMELPELSLGQLEDVDFSTAPTVGQTIKFNGTSWVPANDTGFVPGSIDVFTDVDTSTVAPTVGQVLTWDGTNWVPQASTSWIYGSNSGVVLIDPAWTLPISTVQYSNDNRMFKFVVTATMPPSGLTKSVEVRAVIDGNITANTETVSWNSYGRLGTNLADVISISINSSSKLLTVSYTNNEALQIRVSVLRIQHAL